MGQAKKRQLEMIMSREPTRTTCWGLRVCRVWRCAIGRPVPRLPDLAIMVMVIAFSKEDSVSEGGILAS